jgi:hypothetical protein
MNEFYILLVLAMVITSPYFLTLLLYSPLPQDHNAHRKLSELQAEMNIYLSQQRHLSNFQQDFTLTLSHFSDRINEKELVLSASDIPEMREINPTVLIRDEKLLQVTDKVISLSQSLTSALQTIQYLESQIVELEKQILKIHSESTNWIEMMVTNSIFEQIHSEIENYCSILSVNLTDFTDSVSCSTLDKSQLIDLVTRLSALLQEKLLKTHPSTASSLTDSTELFEFPSFRIAEVIPSLTSSTYRYPQSGLVDGQILPALGYAPNFLIGGPEEAISNNTSLGHCWAMEVCCFSEISNYSVRAPMAS